MEISFLERYTKIKILFTFIGILLISFSSLMVFSHPHQQEEVSVATYTKFIKPLAGETHYINSCTKIFESGKYVLTQDINFSTDSCIEIYASNVEIDCRGHKITSLDGGVPYILNKRRAIWNWIPIENLTVKNCNFGIIEVDNRSSIYPYYINIAKIALFSPKNIGLYNLTNVYLSFLCTDASQGNIIVSDSIIGGGTSTCLNTTIKDSKIYSHPSYYPRPSFSFERFSYSSKLENNVIIGKISFFLYPNIPNHFRNNKRIEPIKILNNRFFGYENSFKSKLLEVEKVNNGDVIGNSFIQGKVEIVDSSNINVLDNNFTDSSIIFTFSKDSKFDNNKLSFSKPKESYIFFSENMSLANNNFNQGILVISNSENSIIENNTIDVTLPQNIGAILLYNDVNTSFVSNSIHAYPYSEYNAPPPPDIFIGGKYKGSTTIIDLPKYKVRFYPSTLGSVFGAYRLIIHVYSSSRNMSGVPNVQLFLYDKYNNLRVRDVTNANGEAYLTVPTYFMNLTYKDDFNPFRIVLKYNNNSFDAGRYDIRKDFININIYLDKLRPTTSQKLFKNQSNQTLNTSLLYKSYNFSDNSSFSNLSFKILNSRNGIYLISSMHPPEDIVSFYSYSTQSFTQVSDYSLYNLSLQNLFDYIRYINSKNIMIKFPYFSPRYPALTFHLIQSKDDSLVNITKGLCDYTGETICLYFSNNSNYYRGNFLLGFRSNLYLIGGNKKLNYWDWVNMHSCSYNNTIVKPISSYFYITEGIRYPKFKTVFGVFKGGDLMRTIIIDKPLLYKDYFFPGYKIKNNVRGNKHVICDNKIQDLYGPGLHCMRVGEMIELENGYAFLLKNKLSKLIKRDLDKNVDNYKTTSTLVVFYPNGNKFSEFNLTTYTKMHRILGAIMTESDSVLFDNIKVSIIPTLDLRPYLDEVCFKFDILNKTTRNTIRETSTIYYTNFTYFIRNNTFYIKLPIKYPLYLQAYPIGTLIRFPQGLLNIYLPRSLYYVKNIHKPVAKFDLLTYDNNFYSFSLREGDSIILHNIKIKFVNFGGSYIDLYVESPSSNSTETRVEPLTYFLKPITYSCNKDDINYSIIKDMENIKAYDYNLQPFPSGFAPLMREPLASIIKDPEIFIKFLDAMSRRYYAYTSFYSSSNSKNGPPIILSYDSFVIPIVRCDNDGNKKYYLFEIRPKNLTNYTVRKVSAYGMGSVSVNAILNYEVYHYRNNTKIMESYVPITPCIWLYNINMALPDSRWINECKRIINLSRFVSVDRGVIDFYSLLPQRDTPINMPIRFDFNVSKGSIFTSINRLPLGIVRAYRTPTSYIALHNSEPTLIYSTFDPYKSLQSLRFITKQPVIKIFKQDSFIWATLNYTIGKKQNIGEVTISYYPRHASFELQNTKVYNISPVTLYYLAPWYITNSDKIDYGVGIAPPWIAGRCNDRIFAKGLLYYYIYESISEENEDILKKDILVKYVYLKRGDNIIITYPKLSYNKSSDDSVWEGKITLKFKLKDIKVVSNLTDSQLEVFEQPAKRCSKEYELYKRYKCHTYLLLEFDVYNESGAYLGNYTYFGGPLTWVREEGDNIRPRCWCETPFRKYLHCSLTDSRQYKKYGGEEFARLNLLWFSLDAKKKFIDNNQ